MGLKSIDITYMEGRKMGKGSFFSDIKPHIDSGISIITPINEKEALVEFRFSANYAGLVAAKIEGELVFEGDAAALAKEWNQNAKLLPQAAPEIQNSISILCSLETSILFKDLMLSPTNLPLPEDSPLKGFEITAIEGKRFTKHTEKFMQIRIDHNSTVTQISEVNDKEANLEFRFTANYVGVGVIKTEGRLLYACDAPSVVAKWATEHNMPEKMANDVHTGILHFGIPEAVLVARELKLPPPIPLPQVAVQKKQEPPPKAGGQEVA